MFPEVLDLALKSIDLTSTIQNGFRACGFFPFNPKAVDYNVINKERKRKTASNPPEPHDKNENSANNKKEFLSSFEKNILFPSILDEFKRNELEDSWTSDLKYQELFEAWRKMKNLSSDT